MREDYLYFRSKGDSGALLVLANSILLLCRSKKSRVAVNFLINVGFYIDEGHKPDIPDFALDRHTKKGKKMGRNAKHFIQEGSKLYPISEAVEDKYKEGTEKRLLQDKWEVKSHAWVKEKKKA